MQGCFTTEEEKRGVKIALLLLLLIPCLALLVIFLEFSAMEGERPIQYTGTAKRGEVAILNSLLAQEVKFSNTARGTVVGLAQ